MKQIACNKPGQLSFREVPEPSINYGEALLKIRRIGVCGTDLHAFRGEQPFFTYPRVLGHELSAEVLYLASDVTELQSGDKVVVLPYLECGQCVACRNGKPNCCKHLRVLGVHTDGGMSEQLCVPADHLLSVTNLSWEEAATVECLSIGAHAVRRSRVKACDTVVVIGAGPIGLGVMKFAKLRGAKVIAVDTNQERLKFSLKWAQVDGMVDVRNGNAEQTVLQLTDGDGPSIVFDATGNSASMENAHCYAQSGGSIVFVGLVQGDLKIPDAEFHRRELELIFSRNALKADFEWVIQEISAGHLDIASFVTHRISFADTVNQFAGLTQPEIGVIKAMVEID